ncbi:MAG: sulfatase-like hydrolase/transferase [Chloroflexota bacterium]|nr:sulfatase-like hydrolase/transferase [Chloroflexota bacterium]
MITGRLTLQFLMASLMLWISLAPVLRAQVGTRKATNTRANIVLLLTDDQDLRLGSLDVMPRLEDLIANQGMTFANAFVPISLCCPARVSLLTGQYAHNHQNYYNLPPLGGFQKFHDNGQEETTIAVTLEDAGYQTALIGKYLNNYPTIPPLTPSEIAGMDDFRRGQLRSLQAVDELVESVVLTLQDAGQLENTYIFFASDNGLHMGQHRYQVGKGTPYAEDLQIPLLVRGPGVAPGTSDGRLAALIDLAPTFAEIAETSPLVPSDGRSLLPLMLGGTPPDGWRQAILFEHWRPESNAAAFPNFGSVIPEALTHRSIGSDPPVPDFTGLRTESYKYISRIGPARELYDMVSDPYEIYNQYDDADLTFKNQLSSWLNAYFVCAGSGCQEIDSAQPPPWALLYHRADINRDGNVDVSDVTLAAACWKQYEPGICGDRMDLDYDADIDVVDVQRVAAAWNS